MWIIIGKSDDDVSKNQYLYHFGCITGQASPNCVNIYQVKLFLVRIPIRYRLKWIQKSVDHVFHTVCNINAINILACIMHRYSKLLYEKLYSLDLLVAVSTTRQNQPIWDFKFYIAATFKPIMRLVNRMKYRMFL